ncbi:MAG: BLUF domain-containing protein [Sphingomonas sp.]|uniref:BLUF domain-containing protein n=1 Tax=Sphingomonas sp. TaxID=28214 RepID=UPI001ACDE20E|nr:BLUF domain-containing protein [Sphingomonas sp.]MBN8807619.1 BLUF domain-containing protein [Sphingomonas sp.]
MRQLVYRSITTASSGLAADDCAAIAKGAYVRNGIDGISGLLFADGDTFVQAIEGEDGAVEALVARLKVDPRHGELDVLIDRIITVRDFGGWSMACRERGEHAADFAQRLRGLLSGVSPDIARHFEV